jgi:putative ABC transport system ATP-binding protein
MLISIDNLKKNYQLDQSEVPVLKGISLTVNEGEFVAIMGPSGSGKSTFMHILGLLDKPSSGEYLLAGEKVHGFNDQELSRVRNREIGYVFQFHNLLPQLTLLENVEMPMVYSNVPRKQRIKRATELIEAVGLGHRINHVSTKLSGGESQRGAIARALANDPKLILADEPTGNLDTKTGNQIMSILQKLNDMGRTIVLVTHEPDIAKFTKRMLFLRDGNIERDEPIQDRVIIPCEVF